MITKITELIKVLMSLVGLLPAVIELMKAVEGPGHGAEKKAAVLNLISQAIDTANSVANMGLPKDTIMAFVGQAIDVIAGLMNVIGTFRKAADTPTA